jgi:hypothetical protein
MDIFEAAGYDEESFAKVQHIVADIVGTGNSLEHIVRKGAETLDRDSYVAGMLIVWDQGSRTTCQL